MIDVGHLKTEQEAHQLVRQPKPRATQIRPKAVEGDIFDVFFRGDFQPEIISDVMSGAAVDYVDLGVRAKFGES